jgi:DNA-binding NtrC family response regulator
MEEMNFLQNQMRNDLGTWNQNNHEPKTAPQPNRIIFCDRPKIVLLEDDQSLAFSLKVFLEKRLNAEVLVFNQSSEFVEQFLYKSNWDQFCFLTDISLGSGHDGLFLVDLMNERAKQQFSIVMTGFATIENAIAATKKGVYHYLTKPFELEQLAKIIADGFAHKLKVFIKRDSLQFDEDKVDVESSPKTINYSKHEIIDPEEYRADDLFCGMLGRSISMKLLFERIQKVASTASTVLITGESGTGKELVAKAIHQLSNRNAMPMVSINCGAIPAELLESELFGHVQGAFTGAVADKKGKFLMADNSSIFLDEIAEMPKTLQIKLLHVLQNRQFEAVGSNEPITVNSRVITATHQDLEKAVAEGTFREDLYYRLNVIPLKIPALKERKEDIQLLISYFLKKYVSADLSNRIRFSKQAFELILNYNWPGNVRELENLIERLVILKGGSVIMPEDLPNSLYQVNSHQILDYKKVLTLPEKGLDLKKLMTEIEESLINQALERTGGNKNKAAQLLQLNRTTLIEKLKRFNLEN